jgi:hypothetical protein
MNSRLINYKNNKNSFNHYIFNSNNKFNLAEFIISILVFFPSITFGIYEAEVFPYAAVYSILYSKFKGYLFYCGLLFLLTYFIFSNLFVDTDIFFESIRILAAYANIFMIVHYLSTTCDFKILKFARLILPIFYFLLLLIIIQYFSLINFIDPFIKLLVPRASSELLGSRGITLLSTEPARGGIEFLFLYIFVRQIYIRNSFRILFDIIIMIISAFAFRSVIVLFFSICIFLIFRPKLLPITLAFLFTIFNINFDGFNIRVLQLIQDLKLLDYDQWIYLLIQNSGNRLFSIFVIPQFLLDQPFGAGVGNWKDVTRNMAALSGYDLNTLNYFTSYDRGGFPIEFRASGFMFNAMLDFGLIGFLIINLWLFIVIKKSIHYEEGIYPILILFLIKIYFLGSVGTPVEWVIFFLLIRIYKMKNFNLSKI